MVIIHKYEEMGKEIFLHPPENCGLLQLFSNMK